MLITADALKILKRLYKNSAKNIKVELESYAKNFARPNPITKKIDWYKNLILYTVYPDGVIYSKKYSPLKNLSFHIAYLKKLNCNAMYILPFLDSPLTDAGFDVSNHYTLRNDLGNFTDLKKLIRNANKAGVHLFMDLILNHVSNQHEWVRKAQNGDLYFRDYFFTIDKKPEFLGKVHTKGAVFGKYKIKGKVIKVNIAFPEFSGLIPHWQQGPDGYWYYHSFRPEQLDLNWNNPHIFVELAKVMLFWGSLGFNFRLDAIPYVGRTGYKITDKPSHNRKGQLIMHALKLILQKINPRAIFLVESYEDIKQVISYFGTARQPSANLSYNFHLSTNIWISLIKRDQRFIIKTLHQQASIPQHAEWLNFLRNHDELSFAHVNKIFTVELTNAILKFGKVFREGHGVSGRTYALLGANKKRFLMAYFLLASMPGSLMLTYGDEIAFPNVPSRTLSAAKKIDSRNINRGTIRARDFNNKENSKILHHFKNIFAKRITLSNFLASSPQSLINKDPGILLLRYKDGREKLIICINLTNQHKEIHINTKKMLTFHSVNKLLLASDKIILGPYAGIWLTNLKAP